MSIIIQNAAKVTEANKVTYLISRHRHDFVTYEFKDGSYYFLDGGAEYFRRGGNWSDKDKIPYSFIEDYSLTEDSNFQLEIINKLLWGTRDKNGDKELIYKPLMCLTRTHLKAILKTQGQIKGTIYEKVINHILEKGYK